MFIKNGSNVTSGFWGKLNIAYKYNVHTDAFFFQIFLHINKEKRIAIFFLEIFRMPNYNLYIIILQVEKYFWLIYEILIIINKNIDKEKMF